MIIGTFDSKTIEINTFKIIYLAEKQNGIMYNFYFEKLHFPGKQVMSNMAFCQLFRFYFCGAHSVAPPHFKTDNCLLHEMCHIMPGLGCYVKLNFVGWITDGWTDRQNDRVKDRHNNKKAG